MMQIDLFSQFSVILLVLLGRLLYRGYLEVWYHFLKSFSW